VIWSVVNPHCARAARASALVIIENNETDINEFEPLLSRAAQYYDAAFNSKDRQDYNADFLLSGAAAYFLSRDFGSSKVLTRKLFGYFEEKNQTPQLLLLKIYAYALASDEEKELIEQFFIKTEEKLKNYTTEQLRGYSYGMLGVDLSVKIEKWIIEKELTEKVISEEDLLSLIVEFFLQNEECKLKDKLYEICCLWIKGRTPIEISLETGCDISNVDDVCNKVISYRLSILIGNICDLINVPEDDDTKVNPYTTLNILQNKIKYGVSSQTAISICEKMFNDRVLASKLTEILKSETIDTDNILRIVKGLKIVCLIC